MSAAVLLAGLLCAGLFLAPPAVAFEFDFSDLPRQPAETAPQLRTAGTFRPADASHLAEAYEVAVGRLRRHASCRALFEPFGGDGERLLTRSLYVRAGSHHESQICGRRVAAFTAVGSPVTRLCRNFRRLDAEQGALILIHEALHYAGLSEAPHEPDAPSSREINEMVASGCGL